MNGGPSTNVADPKLLISDPDPTWRVISNPDPTLQVVLDPDALSRYFRQIFVFALGMHIKTSV